jgi:hypothetical protein
VSTSSERLATESASVAVSAEAVHAAGDGGAPLLPHAAMQTPTSQNANQGVEPPRTRSADYHGWRRPYFDATRRATELEASEKPVTAPFVSATAVSGVGVPPPTIR